MWVKVKVSPALAGKTHCFVRCCLLWRQVNIPLNLQHALVDFNQNWVIDTTWGPSFVDKVKVHLRTSCIKIGWKCESVPILKKFFLFIYFDTLYWTLCMFMWSKVNIPRSTVIKGHIVTYMGSICKICSIRLTCKVETKLDY